MWFFDVIFKRNENKEENYKKLFKFLSKLGGNTEYEIECQDCGYKEKFMIGCGHTGDYGMFSREPYYCPTCNEFLIKHYKNQSGNSETPNEHCPNCGTKTKKYKMNKKIKLVCPQCKKDNIKVTDLESFWMT